MQITEAKTSIVEQVADGSLKVESQAEFENLLKIFPDKAWIQRAHGDFLLQNDNPVGAYMAYDRAADLFLQEKMGLQAVVAKILSWAIVKPDHDQGRLFHAALQANLSSEMPLQNFFAEMSYPELIAFMRRMTRMRLPEQSTVIEAGALVSHIFFVVSGRLRERPHAASESPASTDTPPPKTLSANDIFGDVFPFDQDTYNHAHVETLTNSEMIKIEKQVLVSLFKKFPRIELLLAKLYKGKPQSGMERPWVSVRRANRHEIPIRLKLRIQPQGRHQEAFDIGGFTRDVSLGGACIDLDESARSAELHQPVGSAVEIQLNLPNADTRLTLNGEIVWNKKTVEKGKMCLIIGVQFRALRESERDLLTQYCFGGDGEQNLMWNLWESYRQQTSSSGPDADH